MLGIGWGLPDAKHYFSYHPDEPVVSAYAQTIQPNKLEFAPGFYNYGTLYLSVVRIASIVVDTYTGGDRSTDLNSALADGKMQFVGRVISAFAGAGTAWIVFLFLVRRTCLTGAVFGGGMMAIASGHVINSRFQTVDVFAAFLSCASLYFACKPLGEAKSESDPIWRDYLLAGIFCGLSAGTKYIGALGLLPILLSIILAKAGNRFTNVAVATASMAAAFIIATPGAIVDNARFLQGIEYEMAHTAAGHGLVFAGTSNGFVYHIANLSEGFGILAVLIGGGGLIGAAMRRKVWSWPVLLLALSIYVVIGRAEVKFFRYVIPLIPLLAIGFGWLVGQAQQCATKKWRILVGAAIVAAGFSLRQTIVSTIWMSGTDPRDSAASDLSKYPTVGVVTDPWFYTPPMYPLAGAPRWVPIGIRDEAMNASQNPRVVRFVESGGGRPDWDYRLVEELSPDAIVMSSFETEGYERLAMSPYVAEQFSAQVDNYKRFMNALRDNYEVSNLYGADGPAIHDLMYIRPKIVIWTRKKR